MADCTKTVEFIRELVRLCDSNSLCSGCPLHNEQESCEGTPSEYLSEDAISIVQKWSDEHPVMTWAGKLRELLPHAPIGQIMDEYCPYQIFGDHAPYKEDCEAEGPANCLDCWSGEYKEAT